MLFVAFLSFLRCSWGPFVHPLNHLKWSDRFLNTRFWYEVDGATLWANTTNSMVFWCLLHAGTCRMTGKQKYQTVLKFCGLWGLRSSHLVTVSTKKWNKVGPSDNLKFWKRCNIIVGIYVSLIFLWCLNTLLVLAARLSALSAELCAFTPGWRLKMSKRLAFATHLCFVPTKKKKTFGFLQNLGSPLGGHRGRHCMKNDSGKPEWNIFSHGREINMNTRSTLEQAFATEIWGSITTYRGTSIKCNEKTFKGRPCFCRNNSEANATI